MSIKSPGSLRVSVRRLRIAPYYESCRTASCRSCSYNLRQFFTKSSLKPSIFELIPHYNSRLHNYKSIDRKSLVHSSSEPLFPNFTNELGSDAAEILEQNNNPALLHHSDDLSCTIFDSDGNVEAVSRKCKQSDFIFNNGLHPRDMRHIDVSKSDIIPSILVRKDSILVCLLEIRAVIKNDKIILIDNFEGMDTKKFGVFVYNLGTALRCSGSAGLSGNISSGLPYEMRALEAILMYVVASMEIELKANVETLNSILQQLEDHIEHLALRELLVGDKSLSKFHQKSKMVCTTISKLLDNDEDLVEMFLTERKQGVQRDTMDHSESELLLESYYKQVDEIVQQAEQVHNNIKNTEEIIIIMLDSNRNSLMLFELRITIATLGFSVGLLITALYGMNLKNYFEESYFGFVSVTALTIAFTLLVTAYNLRTLISTQKVTLLSHKFQGKSKKEQRAMIEALKSGRYNQRQKNMMKKWLIDKS